MKKNDGRGVCFFNSTPAWGGGEKWHCEIALKAHDHGYPVLVFTNTNSALSNRLKDHDIPLESIKVGNLSFLSIIKIIKIARILKKNSIRTIVLNLSADLKIAGLAARLAGVKKIIYRRGLAKPVKNSWLNRFLYRKIITHLLVNSEATRQMVLKSNDHLIPDDRISIVYNGIDLEKFDRSPVTPVYQRKEGEIFIGNCGRLVKQKGQHYLIEVAQRLKQANKPFKILIAGSGPLEGELKRQAEKSGVGDSIIFLGFVEDIKSFMHTIDIFVLTSLWEGFGYVIIEAMASRKPVVAFRVSSNPELVNHGENGFLVESGNAGELNRFISRLIESPELCEEMGKCGRQTVENRFSVEQTFKNVSRLFN